MHESDYRREFAHLTASVDADLDELRAFERDAAFVVEPRPIPKGLIPLGIPLGHIAFMGDFDQAPQEQRD